MSIGEQDLPLPYLPTDKEFVFPDVATWKWDLTSDSLGHVDRHPAPPYTRYRQYPAGAKPIRRCYKSSSELFKASRALCCFIHIPQRRNEQGGFDTGRFPISSLDISTRGVTPERE